MSVLVGLPSGNAGLVGDLAAPWRSSVSSSPTSRPSGRACGSTPDEAPRSPWPPCLLAQPSIGLNYAGLLLPAVVALWSADRVAGFLAILTVPLVTVISPPVASLVVIGLAVLRPGERLGLVRAAAAPPTASTTPAAPATPANPG